MTHPAEIELEALLGQCDVRFTRRSGPGGQNRNKVETAAILSHRPTGILAEANERRSQAENRDQALFRLRMKMALQIRVPRGDASPSSLWKLRSRGGRITLSPSHVDFPAMLAEALDVLEESGGDLKLAAEKLGVSSSQLIKFLKDEPRAMAQVNVARRALGLHPFV